ncbi:MAG: SDR family NAD(P)-dependent oxidoreductase [Beijerinckiaceae bacterium]
MSAGMSAGRLAGRVALITGGGGEIGGAIARRFALEEAAVLVTDVDRDKAEAVAVDIRARGGRAAARALDVGAPGEIEATARAAVAEFGRLTTLANVAVAVTPNEDAVSLDLEDWNRALAINLTASFLTAKYCVPHMRVAGGGAIVNIASNFGQIGQHKRIAYGTTKAALIQLTKCLAVDFAADNIRANTISPGAIDTARSLRNYGTRENSNRVRGPGHLLGRTGDVGEIAAAAAFLASNEASFITGTDLLVDGGYLAFKGELALAAGQIVSGGKNRAGSPLGSVPGKAG